MKIHCWKCGAVNDINIGSILGSRTSKAKAEAARRNAMGPGTGKKRGRPPKHKAPLEVITQQIPQQPEPSHTSAPHRTPRAENEPTSTDRRNKSAKGKDQV